MNKELHEIRFVLFNGIFTGVKWDVFFIRFIDSLSCGESDGFAEGLPNGFDDGFFCFYVLQVFYKL